MLKRAVRIWNCLYEKSQSQREVLHGGHSLWTWTRDYMHDVNLTIRDTNYYSSHFIAKQTK